jgi:hypothetical protein
MCDLKEKQNKELFMIFLNHLFPISSVEVLIDICVVYMAKRDKYIERMTENGQNDKSETLMEVLQILGDIKVFLSAYIAGYSAVFQKKQEGFEFNGKSKVIQSMMQRLVF